jgi:hypothetical protein
MIRYSAVLMYHYQMIESTGKTSYEYVNGRKFTRQVPEYGECVIYLRANSLQRNKFTESRWEEGAVVGIREKPNELIIATPEGIVQARTFRPRGSLKESWNKAFFNKRTGSLFEPVIGREGIEVKSSIRLRAEQEEEEVRQPQRFEERHRLFRVFQIRKQDVVKHGATTACNGCKAALAGTKAVNHTDTCRKRIGATFQEAKDPRLDREGDRLNEHIEQQYDERIEEGIEDKISEQKMSVQEQRAHDAELEDVFGTDAEPDEVMGGNRGPAQARRWHSGRISDMNKLQKVNSMTDEEHSYWGDIRQMAY